MSEQVQLALISTIGGIVVTVVTMQYRTLLTKRNRQKSPKDRWEQMFDGYERLIKQKDTEDERKSKIIQGLEDMVDHLEKELRTTKDMLTITRAELNSSMQENNDMKTALHQLRIEHRELRNGEAQ